MSRPSLRIPRLLPVAVIAAAAALALTGCEPGALAPTDSPEPSTSVSGQPSETPSETPDETPDASAGPGETETPGQTETPQVTTPPVAGDLPCSEVFTADQLYDFNPNFAPTSDRGTLPGAVANIAEAGGTVCVYQHVTGADRLVIGVLQGMSSFSAPAFETVGDEGVATVPTDGAVVSAASIYFASERDAQPVTDDVVANLG